MKVSEQNSTDALKAPATKNPVLKRYSKLRIIKNIIVLSIGVHLLFTAYDGLAMLQSTMNREKGIGVISQAVVYISFCISAVLFPKYVIKRLGSKLTIGFTMLTNTPYLATNFYLHFAFMIPTSILVGLAAALLWVALAIYLNGISQMYAEQIMSERERMEHMENGSVKNRICPSDSNHFVISNNDYNNTNFQSHKKELRIPNNETSETLFIETGNVCQYIDARGFQENEQKSAESFKSSENFRRDERSFSLAKSVEASKLEWKADIRRKLIESTGAIFFGIQGVAYLSSHVTSNLMTYFILQSEVPEGAKSNSSCICGASYCNVKSACFEENLVMPSDQMRYILTGICICIAIVSVLVVLLFLDPIETQKEPVPFSTDLMLATFKFAQRKEVLLLIPISFYVGMVQGFFTGDFNKSFVGCAWGTYHVGLVAVCYGTVCGVSSLSSGWLVKRLGRIPIFVTATVVNLGASVFLLSWTPSADEPLWFFVGGGLWGVFVGTILSQLRAFYGVLFKADEEVAFAAFHVWYSLGFALSFAYSNYLCTFVKIYVLITLCILGFIGYLSVEIMHLRNKVEK